MKGKKAKIHTGDETKGSGHSAGAAADESAESAEEREEREERGRPRVVDRRRIKADAEGNVAGESTDAEEEEAAPRVPAYVEQLQAKVKAAEEQLKDHIERLDKETAEFRARQERELERRTEEVRKQAVTGFLDIADDLARATAAVDGAPGGGHNDTGQVLETLVQGVRMIQGRFFQELAALGVQPFGAEGEKFNPQEHEAVRMVDVTDPAQDGVVVEELVPGYRLGESVLRPARVSVGRLKKS